MKITKDYLRDLIKESLDEIEQPKRDSSTTEDLPPSYNIRIAIDILDEALKYSEQNKASSPIVIALSRFIEQTLRHLKEAQNKL